ncbi:MinD/ParA family ATP-binding protein [Aeoliella mucimassa]|uniref:Uncharacterized protein n=1 Tax=Aeoliella mucimassa TaxID=2527972 RepID=A0A518AKS0_9BACT|nr:hypothetical protein [Aeoliella mucimassa]QDU55333.1 hypothetical protein Pan181_15220 [Aeoliella mucimassa]
MDDQAYQLRQLVRAVRQAAAVSTGPPLFVFVAANQHSHVDAVSKLLLQEASTRSIEVARVDPSQQSIEMGDWQIAELIGPYQASDEPQWKRASACVLMSTADDDSILASYKLLKQVSGDSPLPRIEIVVWSESQETRADTAADRLQQTCERFLAAPITHTVIVKSPEEYGRLHLPQLVDRLAMLAPVASSNDHSPIASTPSQ